jgi:acyl-CoA synthetase (AMP-forming)/AMP-acid ligase II
MPAGELWVQSPSVRLGYLRQGLLELAAAPSDWVATGDLAELQPDGSVRILGRLRPLINRAGVKIAPGEIERILEEHPGVAQARVVAMPHDRLGDVPLAYVVPQPGLAPCPTALMSHCRELLGAAFVPAQVELVAQLPMAFRSWKEVMS